MREKYRGIYAIKELTILSRENGAVFYMIAGKTRHIVMDNEETVI